MTQPSNQSVTPPPIFSNLQAMLCCMAPYCSDQELLSLARTCKTMYQGITEKFLNHEWRVRGLKKAILLDVPLPHQGYVQWHSPEARGQREAAQQIRNFLRTNEITNPEMALVNLDGDIIGYAPTTLPNYTRSLLIEGVGLLSTGVVIGIGFNFAVRPEDSLGKSLMIKSLLASTGLVSISEGAINLKKWTMLKSPETYQKVAGFFYSSVKRLSKFYQKYFRT